MACPIPAAMRVAVRRSIARASMARSTRPPSIGKAGRRLKSTRTTLVTSNWSRKVTMLMPRAGSTVAATSSSERGRALAASMPAKRPAAITTFTAGPARAMRSS